MTFRLLYLTRDFTNRMEKSSFYLLEELKKHTEVMVWDQDGSISEIITHIGAKPDFILLNDMKPDYCPRVYGLGSCDIPYGAILHDLHYKKPARKRYIERENIRHIFSIYRDASDTYFPEYKDRIHWFPHHVPLDVFRDYQLEKSINWLMAGARFKHLYPVRAAMHEIMKDEPGFVSYPHPGYGELDRQNYLVGEKYAMEINRAKMFITCDSNDHFPLMKYYEVLACNTLLLATPSKELEDLGFIDGETFVAVNQENIKEKAYHYLYHEKERLAISQRGYEMVRSRHSTAARAKELLEKIERIIGKAI
ncbi:glycosyltransferase family protein [Bacillus infantis]|uniref:glycosyltransferase family protein n=1 Tax=Bacillus infantis TaxID=324767 RepID=UPI003CF9642F